MDDFVKDFLTNHNLAQYLPAFAAAKITQKHMRLFNEEFAAELIVDEQDQLKFLRSLRGLKRNLHLEDEVPKKLVKTSASTSRAENDHEGEEEVSVKIQSIKDPDFVWFRINRNSPLSEVLKEYCAKMGLPEWQYKNAEAKHLFMVKKIVIYGHESPAELKMKNNDIICIYKC